MTSVGMAVVKRVNRVEIIPKRSVHLSTEARQIGDRKRNKSKFYLILNNF